MERSSQFYQKNKSFLFNLKQQSASDTLTGHVGCVCVCVWVWVCGWEEAEGEGLEEGGKGRNGGSCLAQGLRVWN